jgi:hypothetical protein
MIGKCLSNKNKSATIAKIQKFCKLNKAFISFIAAALTHRNIELRKFITQTLKCLHLSYFKHKPI